MIIGVLPLAIAAIGASYAALVLRGARRRDNVVFGLLALTDAAMTAWRGINVLTGGSIIARGVIVPCSLGTVLLALITLEFIVAFPGRKPMGWRWRAAMLAWGVVGLALTARMTHHESLTDPSSKLVFFLPVTLLIFGVGWRSFRATSNTGARIVIGMLWFRWAFGLATYFVGPLIGAFEELVWAETTFASLIGFVIVGTTVLRTELFSMRQAAAEVVTIATLVMVVVFGGGAAVAAAITWAPMGQLQHIALFGASLVPLALGAAGWALYPRLEKTVLAPLDERRARRLGVQDEPLPAGAETAIAETLSRVAAISNGATVRWQLAAALPASLVARLADGRPQRREETPDLPACFVVPALGADGAVVGALLVDDGLIDRDTYLVARDLAARIALIVERAHAVSELEDARRLAALGEFAAAIAHDIRTPLTSISLNVQIIRRKLQMSDDDAEHLDIALEELARLDRSVAEILEFAKPLRLNAESIDVGELIDITTRGLSPVLSEKGVSLRCAPRLALPIVRGDRQRLRQVLVNLVDNAADASTPGAEVTVRATVSDAGVAIAIEDHGRGIAEADLGRIFEPFFTTRPDGTGLGLAIVHKIIHAHRGELTVRSVQGEGSTFTILLPVGGGLLEAR